ncbi:MAG TPA: phosphoribosylglycinamide formyltransferase [Candidatus Dormibacteraeota bacterium]|nr:phosphoribosylglycinamide formyltransferase [Candidatus Dormibacteraeota bacterium]
MLVSGTGTNLRALLDAAGAPDYPARVAVVISNRRSAGALDIARAHGVPAVVLPVGDFGGSLEARDAAIRDALLAAEVRLVVCAGYDRVLTAPVLDAFPDAILNVHPSLLPAFAGGMHAVEDALAFGAKVSGCTVQLLEPGEPDGGPVILQAAVPVEEDDDAESLRMRIHQQEWRILPEAVALFCSGRLRREGRRVRILPAETPARSSAQ